MYTPCTTDFRGCLSSLKNITNSSLELQKLKLSVCHLFVFFCKNGVHERRDIDRDIKETLSTLNETLEDPYLLNTRLVQNVERIKIKTVWGFYFRILHWSYVEFRKQRSLVRIIEIGSQDTVKCHGGVPPTTATFMFSSGTVRTHLSCRTLKRPRGMMVSGELGHLTVFCISSPDDRRSLAKSRFLKMIYKSTWHFKAKYLISSFNFDPFYMLDKTSFERARSFSTQGCNTPFSSLPYQAEAEVKMIRILIKQRTSLPIFLSPNYYSKLNVLLTRMDLKVLAFTKRGWLGLKHQLTN